MSNSKTLIPNIANMSGTKKSQSPQNSPAPKSSTRGVMNCKPCQIRKIKCDRALPACGVCQLYQRSCFYDGLPKKRGPKKESLSALIKRIDGLEELLKSEKTPTPPGSGIATADFNGQHVCGNVNRETCGSASSEVSPYGSFHEGSFRANSEFPAVINAEGLVDIYFTYFHRNPYEIVDEEDTKLKLRNNRLSKSVLYALCAVATRYSAQSGKSSSHISAEMYASWAQREIETGDISVESCQALLLLVTAFATMGNGKKAYSILSQAVGTVMTLELYQCSEESDDSSGSENELWRRLFWNCYVMNVFVSTWLERPSLIDDGIAKATMTLSRPHSQAGWQSKTDYTAATDPQQLGDGAKDPDHGLQKLVWIAHILSDANRYLLITDPTTQEAYSYRHKIRHDLDIWAAQISCNLDHPNQLFDGPEANVLLECRIIYHLIHCLIYRPLLPLQLGEPMGGMMIQHWVAEATEIGLRHATEIIELVDQTLQTKFLHLPPFISYCIFTAGTIHAHGVHYASNLSKQGLGISSPPFASSPKAEKLIAPSPEFLSKCMQQLFAMGKEIESARLYRQRLDEVMKEHAHLLRQDVAGYIPPHSNKFFRRYSVELRRKVQGFHTVEVRAGTPTQSQPPGSPEDNIAKKDSSAVAWNATRSHGATKIPFAPPGPSIRHSTAHGLGHSRSFSDSMSLNQAYSLVTAPPMSQRLLPVWTGFQDSTPRQIITPDTPMQDLSSQLTSPIHQQEPAVVASQNDWGGVKDFVGGDSMGYEVLPGSVTAAGPMYQPGEELQSSYAHFQNFSVL